ncbi:MAG: iron-containing alcohol dehydrogenase [Mesorhizobium sp.]|uniref:iron-containing alcohol dehydrogenase n=1 Tax=Mesorhizobium sp. TaxID=1871066 RepID=UPI0011F8AF60|nr:iron-containing alcohol dehydrogenase [Mesorhizobium sp.]TIP30734.1 MAG: iron-containing alcohol dehydrogenase [Mesorhizobium sp.]
MLVNRPAIEDKIARLAAYLGLARDFDAFIAALIDLPAKLGVPYTLSGLNVDCEGRRAEIVAMAMIDSCAPENPVEMSKKMTQDIFDRALEGRLS